MTTPSNVTFEPTSRTYTSQGLKLHYLDWGNETAPPLLLLHGTRDHARSWDWTARALRDRWHVIAVDLRGHGDSQWSPDGAYLAAFQVLDLADLIDSLGYERVTIVAHSFGGNISARYSALFAQRVSKLVLVDGMGPSDPVLAKWAERGPVIRTQEWLEKRRETTSKKVRRMASIEEAIERMAAANKHLSPEQARHLAIHGVRRYDDGYGWKYDPHIGNFLPEDFSVDLTAFYRQITAPTLLFHGSESWTSNPSMDGRAACFREHRVVAFDKAGHWLHHDRLDDLLAELRRFLDGA